MSHLRTNNAKAPNAKFSKTPIRVLSPRPQHPKRLDIQNRPFPDRNLSSQLASHLTDGTFCPSRDEIYVSATYIPDTCRVSSPPEIAPALLPPRPIVGGAILRDAPRGPIFWRRVGIFGQLGALRLYDGPNRK